MSRLVMALAISGVVTVELSCSTAHLASDGTREHETFRAPSIVELLARAPEFEGELIETTGFYGGVVTGPFLTRDHAEILDFDSAFLVADPTDETMREHCADHYVRVRGIFKRLPGPLHAGPRPQNFTIVDVREITILGGNGKETRCWPPEK